MAKCLLWTALCPGLGLPHSAIPLNKSGPLGGREATPRHQRTQDVCCVLTNGQAGRKGASMCGFNEPSQTLAKGVTSEVCVLPWGVWSPPLRGGTLSSEARQCASPWFLLIFLKNNLLLLEKWGFSDRMKLMSTHTADQVLQVGGRPASVGRFTWKPKERK